MKLPISPKHLLPPPLDDFSLALFIKEFLKSGNFKTRKAIVGLPKEDLITRTIELPRMPAKDTYKVITDEFYSYRAFKDDYAVISYSPISAKETKIQYLVVGVKRSVILKWLDILKKSGLETMVLEDSSIAAYRAIKYLNKDYSDDKQWCYLHISYEETAIFITRGEELLFYRSFSYGEKDLTQSDGLTQWLREISNTFSFFSKESNSILNNLFINTLPDLEVDLLEHLKTSSGISSEYINLKNCSQFDFSKVPSPENVYPPDSLLGMVLSKIDSKLFINLIPEDIKNKGKNILKVLTYSLITLSLLAGFSFLSYYLQTNRQETLTNIENTSKNISALSDSLTDYLPVENDFHQLKNKDDNWKILIETYSRKKVAEYFSAVFANLTPGINIDNFSFDGQKTIYLNISSPGFVPAYAYKDALVNTNFFTSVVIKNFSQMGVKYLSSLELVIK